MQLNELLRCGEHRATRPHHPRWTDRKSGSWRLRDPRAGWRTLLPLQARHLRRDLRTRVRADVGHPLVRQRHEEHCYGKVSPRRQVRQRQEEMNDESVCADQTV